MNFSAFTVRPVIITLAAIALIVLWDFFGRVWTPLDRQPAADTQLREMERLEGQRDYQISDRLMAWIDPDSARQQSAEQTEEDREAAERRRREAEERRRQERLAPLPGSQEFEDFRLRVRAVFIRENEAGEKLSLAIAERQVIDSGDVSRLILRKGTQLGGYEVLSFATDYVVIGRRDVDDSRIEIKVFEPGSHLQPETEIQTTGEQKTATEPESDRELTAESQPEAASEQETERATEQETTAQERQRPENAPDYESMSVEELEEALFNPSEDEDIDELIKVLEKKLSGEGNNNDN